MKPSVILFILGSVLLSPVLGTEDSSNTTDEEVNFFINFMIGMRWMSDKPGVLAFVVKKLNEKFGFDAHLVATQDIIDEKTGGIKEVKALELRFPTLKHHKSTDNTKDIKDVDDSDALTDIKGLLDALAPYLNNPHFIYESTKPRSGNDLQFTYLDQNDTYYQMRSWAILNRTYTVTPDELKIELNKIKTQLKDNPVPPSILKFDVDNNFVERESEISPFNMVKVKNPSEAGLEQIQNVAEQYIVTLLSDPEDTIPEKLSKRLKNAYPNFIWIVVQEADSNSDLSSDVQINFGTDMGWKENVQFNIYGYKK